MRKKLKDCQGVRIQAYQHMRDYVEGDKVWYQPQNGNSWLGPASVLCQRGQSVWLRTYGDIRKVAACKVRPYELVDTENLTDPQDSQKKKVVMLEDGLKDVDNKISKNDETVQYLMDMEEEKKDWVDLIDEEKDCIGARYLKVVNHMSFSDYAIFTVELPVSKHGTPEVDQAKQTEVKNLMVYDVFEEVKDEGQDELGQRRRNMMVKSKTCSQGFSRDS